MLSIGSAAANHWGVSGRSKIRDIDYISTFEEMQNFAKVFRKNVVAAYPMDDSHWVVKIKDGSTITIYEFEIAWPGSTGAELLDIVCAKESPNLYIAPLNVLYTLKLSHRYLKNSPHFKKTMDDIWLMRKAGAVVPEYLKDWLPKREAATYTYKHPSLMRSKAEFFSGDGIDYVYDHDSIHEAVALNREPAYKSFQADGAQVQADKTKFAFLPFETQLDSVYEEAAVLAIERAIVPFNTDPEKAFLMALEKVCTSITSGWWREWAWEHYYDVIKLWESEGKQSYYTCFKEGLEVGLVRPHNGSAPEDLGKGPPSLGNP